MNIEQEYNDASRSPNTGKLYMPSLKWGGWHVTPNGARNSFGSPLYNTKQSATETAKEHAKSYGGAVYLFSRKQEGCKLVETITA